MQSNQAKGVQADEEKQSPRHNRVVEEFDYGGMPMSADGYYHL